MKLIITQSNLTLKGGAERVLLKIAQHYKAKIYTIEYDKAATFSEFSELDVEVISKETLLRILPYGRVAQGLSYGLGFYNMRIKDDYDVINAQVAPSHWIRNNNDRVLWYCHTPLRDIYDLYGFRLSMKKAYQKPIYIIGAKAVRCIDKKVIKKIELIVANSDNIKSRVIKYFGRADTQVLGGGVEYESYHEGGDEKYFLYPSRMSPNKRQDYAIRAFEIFKRKIGGYRLLLVGPVSKDGFYYDYYKKVAEQAKRVGDVEIVDDVGDAEMKDLYADATAVLYTPMDEDYGLVPLEAMASYKPIISVNEGGPKKTIIDKETGFLVNSEDEMAMRMKEIAENPSLAKAMGKSGRIRVQKEYSWERFFEQFDKHLSKVAKM